MRIVFIRNVPRDGIYMTKLFRTCNRLQNGYLNLRGERLLTSTEHVLPNKEHVIAGTYCSLCREVIHCWDLRQMILQLWKWLVGMMLHVLKELYEIANDACFQIKEHGKNSLVQGKDGMSGFQYLWYNHCQRKLTETRIWNDLAIGRIWWQDQLEFGLYLQQVLIMEHMVHARHYSLFYNLLSFIW